MGCGKGEEGLLTLAGSQVCKAKDIPAGAVKAQVDLPAKLAGRATRALRVVSVEHLCEGRDGPEGRLAAAIEKLHGFGDLKVEGASALHVLGRC
jgi:hypothetical protein